MTVNEAMYIYREMKAGGHRSSFTPKLSLKSADIELTYAYVSI